MSGHPPPEAVPLLWWNTCHAASASLTESPGITATVEVVVSGGSVLQARLGDLVETVRGSRLKQQHSSAGDLRKSSGQEGASRSTAHDHDVRRIC
jgi:hypothetical protein